MSDLKPLSSENKERLVALVSKTAQYANEGLDPTAALAKAAAAEDYSIDYIQRAAEAYNGAAHLSYFKNANLNERGDSFPLADASVAIGEVMAKVSGINTKTVQDNFAYLPEANNYFTSPIEDSDIFSVKAAAAPTLAYMLKAANSLENQEKLNIAKCQTTYNEACESLATTVSNFQEKTATVSANRRMHWAKEMLERHGKQAESIIAILTKVDVVACSKLANVGYFSLGVADLDSMDSIIRDYAKVNLLNNKLATAEHDHFANGLERNSLLEDLCGLKKKSSIGESTVAGIIGDKLNIAGGGGDESGPAPGEIELNALTSLADPEYYSTSNNIDKAVLLDRIIKSDPIIAKHPVKDINQSLNEIYAIAPTAAGYEPLLRSMLRKRLETGEQIDDFSLNQMISMDEKMKNNTRNLQIAPKIIGGQYNKADAK